MATSAERRSLRSTSPSVGKSSSMCSSSFRTCSFRKSQRRFSGEQYMHATGIRGACIHACCVTQLRAPLGGRIARLFSGERPWRALRCTRRRGVDRRGSGDPCQYHPRGRSCRTAAEPPWRRGGSDERAGLVGSKKRNHPLAGIRAVFDINSELTSTFGEKQISQPVSSTPFLKPPTMNFNGRSGPGQWLKLTVWRSLQRPRRKVRRRTRSPHHPHTAVLRLALAR